VPNAHQYDPNEFLFSFLFPRTADSAHVTARPSGGGFGVRKGNAIALIAFCIGLSACTKYVTLPRPDISKVPLIYRPLYTASINDDNIKAVRSHLPFDSISIKRPGNAWGSSRAYEMVLHRDGNAELNAQAHLPKLGQFIGEVDIHTYGRLCYLLESSHFIDFEPSYSAMWTDDSTCIVTVATGGDSKAVSDYASVGPIELWAIEEVLDATRDKIEWKSRQ